MQCSIYVFKHKMLYMERFIWNMNTSDKINDTPVLKIYLLYYI